MDLRLLQIDRESMRLLCVQGILRDDGKIEILSDATHDTLESEQPSGVWRAVVRVGRLLCTMHLEYDHLES